MIVWHPRPHHQVSAHLSGSLIHPHPAKVQLFNDTQTIASISPCHSQIPLFYTDICSQFVMLASLSFAVVMKRANKKSCERHGVITHQIL